ncbi:MAG: hypothetical protein GY711_06675 [bacterium]|nr:hypothetical protein [bacterium]
MKTPTCIAATLLALFSGCGSEPVPDGPLPFAWPPTAGEAYPDLQLRDTSGEVFQLSSLKGKVLLIEPIGMT